jgi:hypothetical protein
MTWRESIRRNGLARMVVYWLRLYRIHPAIACWAFVDRSPLTPADIARARRLLQEHPEWNEWHGGEE